MQILDGKEVSQYRRGKMKERIEAFKAKYGRAPGLAVVLVGEHPPSQIYVKNKVKACEEIGMTSFLKRVPESLTQAELEALIHSLNSDPQIDGILVQLPLPHHLSEKRILEILDPKKDADGFTHENLGLLFAGATRVAPCTPAGVMAMLEYYKIHLPGKNVVVVGRSLIVGKPMGQLLLSGDATVTVVHSRTKNVQEWTRKADIVVVAAGKQEFLSAQDFKKDSVVIDVGIHRVERNGKAGVVGDVLWQGLDGHVAAASPVPGGVGPMTITMLLENTLKLAEARAAR